MSLFDEYAMGIFQEVSELSEPAVNCFVSEHCEQPGELEMLAGTRAGFLGGLALLSGR